MKLYDKVKVLLEVDKKYRNSDMEVFWAIWLDNGVVNNLYADQGIFKSEFLVGATNPETIGRTIRMVKKDHPELQSDAYLLRLKKKREAEKGTFVYREEI